MFKILNSIAPIYTFFLCFIGLYTYRCMGISGLLPIVVKLLKLVIVYDSISFKMSTVWNKLPRDLREYSSISDFKKSLKTYYFELAFDV